MPPKNLRSFRMGIGQIASKRADVPHNLALIKQHVKRARQEGVDFLAFPELALSGYLVDSRYADNAITRESETMAQLIDMSSGMEIALGFIEETPSSIFHNAAVHLGNGDIRHTHRKLYLPTYRKFDERRYYGPGWNVAAYDTRHVRTSILICGDAWHLPLPYLAAHDGADLLLVLAASSEEGLADTTAASDAWECMCRSYALTLSCFVVFANLANDPDNDEYTFWGGSFVAGPDGTILARSDTDGEDLVVCDVDLAQLREQRIKLPFRRDDSLAHTLELGKHILASKIKRDRFYGTGGAVPKPR